MANNTILNLSEENIASECIVGQANDPSKAVTQIHPVYGTMFTKQVALERAKLVGLKTDGKYYLASAEAGAGQLKAIGWNFQEAVNGQGIDVMTKELEVQLDVAVSGANPGDVAYLSDTTPGAVVHTAPSGTGKMVQTVGTFITNQIVKYKISNNFTINS